MFFIRAAYLAACVGLFFSVLRIVQGVLIAAGYRGLPELAAQRYGASASTGEMIDSGFTVAIISIALGALAEIGMILKRKPPGA